MAVSFPFFLGVSLARTSAASTWEKHYTWDYNEEGASIVQTSDSGFVIGGTTHSFGPGAPDLGNPFLMKLDSQGNLLWFQAYGSTLDESLSSVALAPDGGFIACGTRVSQDFSSSEYYVIKTDSQGDLQWERTYGPTDYLCNALSIAPVRLGGYVIAGCAASFRYQVPGEFLIIRTNMTGRPMWQVKHMEPGYSNYAWSVQETPEGGFVVAGSLVGGDLYDRKMVVVRLNQRGQVKWSRDYAPQGCGGCFAARLTSDGGLILGGYAIPLDSYNSQACLVKTDPDGDPQWKLIYDGGAGSETIYSVQPVSGGGYVACGLTASSGHGQQDLLLLRVDAAGRLLWTRTYGGLFGDYGYSIIQASDGDYAMTGVEYSWGPGAGIYAIKTDQNGNVGGAWAAPAEASLSPLRTALAPTPIVAPNPFVTFSSVPGKGGEIFSVYDVLGRRVGQYRGERIGSDLPPGVYMLRPSKGDDPAVRIVKTR